MLTAAHKETFREKGFVRLRNAVDGDEIEKVADYFWLKLAAMGLRREDPESWRKPKPKGMQQVSQSALFDGLFSDAARGCVDALLGEGLWDAPVHWGQALLSTPIDHAWAVPNTAWHLDVPQHLGNVASPGVQVFVCIENVISKCGATVVAAGSHTLVRQWVQRNGIPEKRASALIQTQLAAEHEWFRLLKSKQQDERRDAFLLAPSPMNDGVKLQIHELTGNSGDLILMHPYLLHAPSPNIGPAIRLAVTQRVYSSGSY